MIKEINLDELQAHLESGAMLVDCREDDEVASGMIPAAKHIALSTLHERKSDIPSDQEIIFYCRSGKRSLKACEIAENWTKKTLYSLAGGYLAYQQENT